MKWVAFALLVVPALLRASVGFNPLPYWDIDPALFPAPITTIGPGMLLLLDATAVLGAAAAVCVAERVRPLAVVLWVVGSGVVIWHAADNLDHLVVGGPWIATLATAVGAAHFDVAAPQRRAALAAAAGFVCVLVCRGAVQVFIEHADTVRDFMADREAFFAARGWNEDSPEARLYVRRLTQAEASGWFGLSNVFASFAALAAVAGCVLSVGLARVRAWKPALACVIAFVAGSLGLWLSGSKGGVGSAVVVMVALGVAALMWRFDPIRTRLARLGAERVAGAAALALVSLGILTVVLRGFAGERLGELSLLFRWFYMQGATRIWASEPMAGVGPAGFKDAYLRAKPELSPEEVTSPHSVVFDWVATLGVGGLAWMVLLGLLLWWIARSWIGRSPLADGHEAAHQAHPIERDAPRGVVLAAVIPGVIAMAASAWFERAMATPDMAIARIVGIAGMGTVAWGVLEAFRCAPATWRLAMGGGAVVVALHAMIEMTPIQPGSGPLWGLFLGAAAAGRPDPTAQPREQADAPRRGCTPAQCVFGTACVFVAAAMLGVGGPRILGWESLMHRAAEPSVALGTLRQELTIAARDPNTQPPRGVLDRVAHHLGVPPAQSPESFGSQLEAYRVSVRSESLDHLRGAIAVRPKHLPTRKAAGRVAAELGDLDLAIGLAEAGVDLQPESPGAWAWLMAVLVGASEREADPTERAVLLDQAVAAGERAAELDPYGVTRCVRLADAEARRGRVAAAAKWASEALRLDDLRRLDPEKQLGDRERARLRTIADLDG